MPQNRVDGVGLAAVVAGFVLVYSGVTGKGVLQSVQSVIQGKSPSGVANSLPISGQDTTTGGTAVTGLPAGSNASVSLANVSQYQSYAFSQFGQYGWGTDQREPLIQLWNKESGWNPTATNPSSGAYGIPQALPASKIPGGRGSSAQTQIDWGLAYIFLTYKTPAMAWAHEQANNWY